MIVANQLSRSYDGKFAVKGLNFSIEPGEILGFLGPNGAGKSTTVKMLTCMIRPTDGSAQVAGYSILQQPMQVKSRIGYVPENVALYETLTAWEYLSLIGNLHHLEKSVIEKRGSEFLDQFGLISVKDQRLAEYSKGMKQKVVIAAAFLHNPQVLFLDEPLNGLDVNSAYVFKELIRHSAQQGKTIFFSSHILEVVERLCTRLIIINQGQIVAQGSVSEIANQAGVTNLEEAFMNLTGIKDYRSSAADFLQALE